MPKIVPGKFLESRKYFLQLKILMAKNSLQKKFPEEENPTGKIFGAEILPEKNLRD